MFKFCPNCTKETMPGWKCCPYCGYKFEEVGSSLGEELDDAIDNLKDLLKERQEQEDYVRINVLRGKYDEAKKFCENLIEKDLRNKVGYIGLIRVLSKNYKEYEGAEIAKQISIVEEIFRDEEDLFSDPEYKKYITAREQYFQEKEFKRIEAIKAEEERKARAAFEAEEARKKQEIIVAKVKGGEIVEERYSLYFGMWPQSLKADDVEINYLSDNDGYFKGSDGEEYFEFERKFYKLEPLKWEIIKKDKGKVLVISEKIIDCKYQDSKSMWLDREFLERAFKASVKKKIDVTHVCNNELTAGSYYGDEDKCGEDYDARIFLLSYSEEYKYSNLISRKVCTDYARALDAKNGEWWLRSLAGRNFFGVFLGKLVSGGWNNDSNISAMHGIVPALWINL